MKTIKKNKLADLLHIWDKEHNVFAPYMEKHGTVRLKKVADNADKDITFDYINFYQPVPDFSSPNPLFAWEKTKEGINVQVSENSSSDKNIYFGVRPCDAAALYFQDAFHLNEYIDPTYVSVRNNIIIIALNCNKAGSNCFCSAMGVGPHIKIDKAKNFSPQIKIKNLDYPFEDILEDLEKKEAGEALKAVVSTYKDEKNSQAENKALTGADIVVTDLDDKLAFNALNARGQYLLDLAKELWIEEKDSNIETLAEAKKEEALASFILNPDLENIDRAIQFTYKHDFWDDVAESCITCSGCTRLCPTCTCFSVIEHKSDLNSGLRMREKDSCQSDGFTRNAGWHNPRSATARVRYRILDKLSHISARFGVPACVGCGRCSLTCPAHIDILNIASRAIEKYREAGSPVLLEMAPERYEYIPIQEDAKLYTPRPARITKIIEETAEIKRFFVEYMDNPKEPVDLSGQFYMLTVFGVGEIAVSIPFGEAPGTQMEFCIKTVGKVTKALDKFRVGDIIGLRGPYGRGFPMEEYQGRDILIVGSGVGLAPVRTVIMRMLENREKFHKIAIIASAFTYEGLIYKEDLIEWAKIPGVKIQYALAKPTDKVDAHVGYINDLLPDLAFEWKKSSAILCASPRRIKSVAADLLKLSMNPVDIYTSLETHMRCGVGKCGHCKVGSHYMCVDGPVFNYKEMLELAPEF